MHKVARKLLRAVANYDPSYYDMYADPNEAFFARLYVERIARAAADAGLHPPATLLEAGCQTGRLAIPLATFGFQVTGIDTSGFALRRARHHARAAGVEAAFLQGDLMEVLQRQPPPQYDIVVCAEVIYLAQDLRAMAQVLAGAVRPGGLLCISHRPMCYYLIEALRHGYLATARRVLEQREGRFEGPFPERGEYNWQDEAGLRRLYNELGLRQIALYPIDRCAWLSGVNVSELTEAEREAWLEMELRAGDPSATCSRYVLVVASQPHHRDTEKQSTEAQKRNHQ